MKLSYYFIDRPILSVMLSLGIFLGGLFSLFNLPIGEYPEVVPPTIVVTTNYPGANPKVIAETVATRLEQEINGVEGLMYMYSQATSDGRLSITITFSLDTDADKAQVQVQNRVNNAITRLPLEVQKQGVVAKKSSPNLTMVVHLYSENGAQDISYLTNYADINIKDRLVRLDGVGEIGLWGGDKYSLRVWLNPVQLEAKNLSPADVITAIRAQNQQVAAGSLGAQPVTNESQFQVLLNVKGRLASIEEFNDIIVAVSADGAVTTLEDVAKIELGQQSYALRASLDSKKAVAIAVSQRPGANAIALSDKVNVIMEELSTSFPDGMTYDIIYDPTVFVRGAIKAVGITLVEAVLLVVLVVILFLQTWRASIIPLIAVPVSLVGTFTVMYWLGVSLNTLSLFGLVLAIGIVVDDAIVVVENVERNIELGLSPVEATQKAMFEVTKPIIVIGIVLCSVFIPTAFISGLSGQFFKQFALTIAISTVISTLNSLTLSPALAAMIMKPKSAKQDKLTVIVNKLFAKRIFAPFNRLFDKLSERYVMLVKKMVRFSGIVLICYLAILVSTSALFNTIPGGFVPAQDKQNLIAIAQLPNSASLGRTQAIVNKMEQMALSIEGVSHTVSFPGLSVNGFSNSSNSGIVFVMLKDFDKRGDNGSPEEITTQLNQLFASIDEAYIGVFPPPPIQGLSTTGGFKLQIEDRAN